MPATATTPSRSNASKRSSNGGGSRSPSKASPTPTSKAPPRTSPAPIAAPAPVPINLSGIWLLDSLLSDSLSPLYDYHHIPYSPSTVDEDVQLLHVEQHADRLVIHHYSLPQSTPLSTFSLSSPPPLYSLSYPISSFSSPSLFLPLRLPHRTTVARCYQAPHLQSLIIDSHCKSKYDLERREMFLASPHLVEEIRVLTCDPTLPVMGRKGLGVATPFREGLEEREVIARNKMVVQELMMIKRVWKRVEVKRGGKGIVMTDDTINGLLGKGTGEKDKNGETEDGRGKDRRGRVDKREKERMQLSHVLEDEQRAEDGQRSAVKSGEATGKAQLIGAVRPPSSASSPLSATDTAGSLASSPLDVFSGVYTLDVEASHSQQTRARCRPPVADSLRQLASSAYQRRQAEQGIKPSPAAVQSSRLCEVLVLSFVSPWLSSSYFVFRRFEGVPLWCYGPQCFIPVSRELMEAQGRRKVGSRETRGLVDGVLLLEEEERADAEGWITERAELRKTERGLDFVCTKEVDGHITAQTVAVYERVTGIAALEDEVRQAHARQPAALPPPAPAKAAEVSGESEATPALPKKEDGAAAHERDTKILGDLAPTPPSEEGAEERVEKTDVAESAQPAPAVQAAAAIVSSSTAPAPPAVPVLDTEAEQQPFASSSQTAELVKQTEPAAAPTAKDEQAEAQAAALPSIQPSDSSSRPSSIEEKEEEREAGTRTATSTLSAQRPAGELPRYVIPVLVALLAVLLLWLLSGSRRK